MMPCRRGFLLGGAALALARPALAQPAGQREMVDAAGRRVTVPVAPRRVFPAGPGAAVLILILAPDRLAGWPMRPSAAMRALLPAAHVDRPLLGRLTGTQPSADADAVRAAGADLVLDMGTVNASYAALADRVQAASSVPAILLDGALSRTAALCRETGALLGAVARGEALAMAAERILADTQAHRAGWSAPRLWYARGERGLGFAAGGAINAEVLELLGCKLPSAAAGGAWGLATPAELAAFDPEIVLAPNGDAARMMRDDPAWQATTAGRAGRILGTPAGPFG